MAVISSMPIAVVIMLVLPSSSQVDIYTYTSLRISQRSAQKHSGNSYGYQHGFFHHNSPVQLLLNTHSNGDLYISCHFTAETPLWVAPVWFAKYPLFAFPGLLAPIPSAWTEAEHPASAISSVTTVNALIFIRVSLFFCSVQQEG
jgi:hypothetical protein